MLKSMQQPMKGELGTVSSAYVGYRGAGGEGPRSVMEKLFEKRINIVHQN